MRSPAVLPALAFVSGVGAGIASSIPAIHPHHGIVLVLLGVVVLASACRTRAGGRVFVAAAFAGSGVWHGAAARDAALHTPLRAQLDARVGGFSIDTLDVAGRHEPIRLRARLQDDAADEGEFVSLRVDTEALLAGGTWLPVGGSMVLSVNGASGRDRSREWRAGRTIEAPVTFRRPARYLNDGVADFERDAALSGITLFGSVKSALLVDVVDRGTWVSEAAADMREIVRRSIGAWVAPYGDVPGAIVTAVLIGDRAGLPDEVRARLQAAGTYHVIAISGGNIAILAAVVVGLVAAIGVHGRYAAAGVIVAVLAYAEVATAGPSVWRATLMAVIYFGARLFDHRAPPLHSLAVAAGVIAWVQPLDVRDAGFLLTFGATLGLLGIARVATAWRPQGRVAAWIVASVAASLAAELSLLPVSATVFSRVTAAGLVLNLVAIPAMAIVEVAGMVVVATRAVPPVAAAAGWIAANGAVVLVESARLADIVPWLSRRVPPPAAWVVIAYYVTLLAAWLSSSSRWRFAAVLVFVLPASLIATGVNPFSGRTSPRLRLTMIDVGQGESMVLDVPGSRPVLIDAGGSPFGGGSFDVGTRVLTPVLWARGIRGLGALLVTHGDPDHIGGAPSVLRDFDPAVIWWGILVPPHLASRQLLERAVLQGSHIAYRRAAQSLAWGQARLRVLNPPEPAWERQHVRNDDSVVLEVVYGDVALLLTGDIDEVVERAIAPQLTPARIRILKVAHHGSRTSSSAALLESWRPQIALISCGRGNTFGHPAPEVLARLTSIGARIYRTDRDGEITLTTDGHSVSVATFTGARHE